MSLHAIVGHAELKTALARAWLRGSLPPSLLIHGHRGVGKQRLALWLGQLLLCDDVVAESPCGGCKPCRLSLDLQHPDLHWYFPLPRPKGVRGDKLGEVLETARHEAIAERRQNALRASVASDEPTGLYFAVAQSLRSQAQRRPAMGPRQVFVIGDAEALVPQESSQAAANALLKILEEPPADTFLILTSSEPGRLLSTIRSRTLSVYVPGLSRDRIRGFLEEVAEIDSENASRAAGLARGSIGRALGFLPDEGSPGPLEELRQQAFRLLGAASFPDAGPIYRQALELRPAAGRGLLPLLDFLEDALRDLAAWATGARDEIVSQDTLEFLERIRSERDIHPVAITLALHRVEEAKEMAAGNVNPQLVVAGLLTGIREALNGRA